METIFIFKDLETGHKFHVASEYVTEELFNEFELISIVNI